MTKSSVDESLRQDLQAVLGQLFELHIQGVEAHAHFIGTRFTGMQQQLEAIVQLAREASGDVAKVLRALDRDGARRLIITEVPPATPGLLPGQRCTTAAVSMITHRIFLLLNTIRRVYDQLGDTDTATAELLRETSDAVGRQACLLATEARSVNLGTRALRRST